MRIWRIARNVLLILGALVALFFLAVVPWFFTRIVTTGRYHFPDPNDGKTPKSYGPDFRWVQFVSTDGIPLKGWYIPAPHRARGTIIYCHGHNRTRIEMLPEAVFAHQLGYNGLLFDLRHQGQSGGTITTVGYYERRDVLGDVQYALNDEKAARPIVLWGVSMGAAAALMAAADSPDVDGVISDSSFLSFRDMIKHHWKLFLPLPTFPIADEVVYWSAWRGGFKVADFDLEKATERIGNRPILFIAVEGDRRMPPSIARKLYADASTPLKRLVVLPGQRHGEGFKLAPQPYKDAVTQFLTNIPRNSSASNAGLQHHTP
jgi:fermentation-respiration switch protein FrsA (DUF1100 family)